MKYYVMALQLLWTFQLFSSEISDLNSVSGIYVTTSAAKQFGFKPEYTKRIMVIQKDRIIQYNFDCTGPGCQREKSKPRVYLFVKKINSTVWQFQSAVTKRKTYNHFILRDKNIIFASKLGNKIDGKPLLNEVWQLIPAKDTNEYRQYLKRKS